MDNTNVCPQGPSHPLSAPWCPNSAPPSSSAAGAVSVWVWIRDVTCAETVPTAQTRATAVSPETHISEVYLWADLRSGALWDWEVCLLSCSRLCSVSLDVLESVQCVVWSGVTFPSEEHPERRPVGRILRRRSIRQPRVFPAGLSWYKHVSVLTFIMHSKPAYCFCIQHNITEQSELKDFIHEVIHEL